MLRNVPSTTSSRNIINNYGNNLEIILSHSANLRDLCVFTCPNEIFIIRAYLTKFKVGEILRKILNEMHDRTTIPNDLN